MDDPQYFVVKPANYTFSLYDAPVVSLCVLLMIKGATCWKQQLFSKVSYTITVAFSWERRQTMILLEKYNECHKEHQKQGN